MRAQSEVIGLVILFGLSVTAIGIVLAFGQPAISDASAGAQFDRMENEFSLLDSSMSTSVLGASEGQTVSLNVEGGSLASNPDASWMSVEYENATGFNSELANVTMGNVKYTQGDRTIAYEGGGVWKSEESGDFTEMVSTPEFHYKGSTLTLPAYNITGSKGFSGGGNSLSMASVGDPKLEFPDKDLDNPLEEGNVTITVKSEYYRGWEEYFRSRTTGAVKEVDEEEQKVVFSLEVPTDLKLTAGVMYPPGGSANVKGGGGGGGGGYSPYPGSEATIDVDLPDSDSIIQPEISKCIPSPQPNCVDLTMVPDGSALDENKIYYKDVGVGNTYQMQKDFHAPDSNVTILIRGDLEYKNDFAVGDSSADPVEVYVDGNVDGRGGTSINTGSVSVGGTTGTGEASSFITYATGGVPGSSGANGFGGADYTGIIYAPNTNHGSPACNGGGGNKIAGNADIEGTIIGNSVCFAGASGQVQYDSSLDFLDLTPDDISLIRFLHITENEVRVRD